MSKMKTLASGFRVSTYGGRGRVTDRRDHVAIINGGRTMIVYPSDAMLAHMTDWPYIDAALVGSDGGEVDRLELTRAERGYNLRRVEHRRPHVHVSLAQVKVETVSDGPPATRSAP